jgi:hypothetical protein
VSAAWLMVTGLQSKTKAELEDLLDRVPNEFRGDRQVYPATKGEIIKTIEEARRRYWDRGPRAPRMEASRRPTITAREVDEWLATLPPVEPHA